MESNDSLGVCSIWNIIKTFCCWQQSTAFNSIASFLLLRTGGVSVSRLRSTVCNALTIDTYLNKCLQIFIKMFRTLRRAQTKSKIQQIQKIVQTLFKVVCSSTLLLTVRAFITCECVCV